MALHLTRITTRARRLLLTATLLFFSALVTPVAIVLLIRNNLWFLAPLSVFHMLVSLYGMRFAWREYHFDMCWPNLTASDLTRVQDLEPEPEPVSAPERPQNVLYLPEPPNPLDRPEDAA